MNILIIGKSGQLSQELLATQPIAESAVLNVLCVGRHDVDITALHALNALFEQFNPSVVINASAYTAVDKAQSDRENAFLINETAVENIAKCCAAHHCKLVHVSTDFVFGSQSAVTVNGIAPLLPSAIKAPMSVYGESKLAGENAVLTHLPNHSIIVRTAWVYSAFGNNFVKTMLNLMATKPELGIIDDQIGSPTWAKGLAKWLWAAALNKTVNGVFHYTDAGVASWYDFAIAIQQLGLEHGLLSHKIAINPIPTSAYPTPAKRPSYSVLDKNTAVQATGLTLTHWRDQLNSMLIELKN